MRQLLVMLALSFCATGVYAQETWDYGDYTRYEHKKSEINTPGAKMAAKWNRGLTNLVTGVAEIPVETIEGYREGIDVVENEAASKTLGTGLGLFRGLGMATSRIGHGAFEVLTFWGANPRTNRHIGWQFDSDYAWEFSDSERLDVDADAYTLEEEAEQVDDSYFAPVGRKVVRGAHDTFLGASELWYQPKEAYYNDESVTLGVGKGLWMFVSRELHGIQDLVFCLLANPETTVGIEYTIPNPWNYLGKPADMQEDAATRLGIEPVED